MVFMYIASKSGLQRPNSVPCVDEVGIKYPEQGQGREGGMFIHIGSMTHHHHDETVLWTIHPVHHPFGTALSLVEHTAVPVISYFPSLPCP